ncbi:MAG: adenosylcobinamide-GDP ribazoletransferase [Spirochaetota bacterium]
MRRFLRSFLFAFSFLTAFPGLGRAAVDERGLGLSVVFYPLAGLLLGALVYGVCLAGAHPLTRAVLAVIVLLAATRGMHADGLLDTFDGFLSGGGSPGRALEVMRDSRVGALGLVGAACVYGVKLVLLFELVLALAPSGAGTGWGGLFPGLSPGDRPGEVPLSAVMIPAAASRGALGLHCLLFPPARGGKGLGGSLVAAVRPAHAAGALALSLALAYRQGCTALLLAVPAAAAVWLLWGLVCRGRIGGITGDTLGAGIEMAETAGYLAVLLAARGVPGCW